MTFSVSVFFLLIIVLSMDAFSAGFSYGLEKVKVPFYSTLTIALVSGTMLTLSLSIGSFLSGLIPETLTKSISFIILFLLALYKFYDTFPFVNLRNKPLTTKVIADKANQIPREVLSLSESLFLSLALSADNISAGICYGLPPFSMPLTLLVTIFIHLLTFLLGILSGRFLSRKCSKDFSFIGAIILALLAFIRLL